MAINEWLGFTEAAEGEVTVTNLVAAQRVIAAALRNTFMSGLKLEWISASEIRVATGGAWCGGTAAPGVVWVTSAISVPSISLGNNAWGNVYLYKSGGAAAVEVVTTAPVLIAGTAYQKTGDASRRYLGSVRTNASGQIFNFIHNPHNNSIRYRCPTSATPHRVLSNGTATTETTVSCQAVVPPVTSRRMTANVYNSAGGVIYAAFGTSDDSCSMPPTDAGLASANAGQSSPQILPLDASQQFSYMLSAASANGVYVDVQEYFFER